MVISEKTFFDVVREDQAHPWELLRGRLREKPAMALQHNEMIEYLGYVLRQQLPWSAYRIRTGLTRVSLVRRGSYFIPDLAIVPVELTEAFAQQPQRTEIYDAPLPLVVEVRSPSTGDFDTTTKVEEYRERGDGEIWLIDVARATLTAIRRQPDGAYVAAEAISDGTIRLVALPAVTVDVADLFRRGSAG